MSIPTNDEIIRLLDRLENETADDLETQWLEFKPWRNPKDDMEVATEYAVCLANAEGGVIVFGVADRTRGRTNAIHGASGYDLDVWRKRIHDCTTNRLLVEMEELSVPEGTGKLLAVRVPKVGESPCGTTQGLYKVRVGRNCLGLNLQELQRARISSGVVDWSGQPAEGVSTSDLDPIELARARGILKKASPQSGLLTLNDRDFLTGLGVVRDERLTNAGLLLFGREEVITARCPQHQVHYVYQVSDTQVARNDSYRCGLLQTIERFEQAFTGPANPEQELSVGMFKLRIPAFPVEVVREALLNAVTHRDYSDPGEVLVRHTSRELVLTSPGGFIAGITPLNILRHEPASRNRTLAEAFEKLRLVERAGIGRKRIFMSMLRFGKRAPRYESDGGRVTLRISDGFFDQRMAVLVAKWADEGKEIDLDGLLILSYLRDNAFVDTYTASTLLQVTRDEAKETLDHLALPETGMLERRGRTKAVTYHLSKGFAKDLLGKAAYTKVRGLDPIRYAELVRAFVRDHGMITPKECRELLGLGESQSARVETSRYLKVWSGKGGFLRREGNGPKVRYLLCAHIDD
jgi:ATP-dependent DNA helicase RecG